MAGIMLKAADGAYIDLSLVAKMSCRHAAVSMWAGSNVEIITLHVEDNGLGNIILKRLAIAKAKGTDVLPVEGYYDWSTLIEDAKEWRKDNEPQKPPIGATIGTIIDRDSKYLGSRFVFFFDGDSYVVTSDSRNPPVLMGHAFPPEDVQIVEYK